MTLQEHLDTHGLTHERLAQLASCSTSYVTRVINGERVPHYPMALRISAALHMTVAELYAGCDVAAAAAKRRAEEKRRKRRKQREAA